MAVTAFVINGQKASVDVEPDTPLLWIVREHLKLAGTKFGCGTGLCGACTVHVDGRAARSCQVTASQVAGKRVTTIEGLSPKADHPLQRAWIAEQVPQCGYCQSGQIMQAADLLARNKKPTRAADRRAHGRQSLPLRHLSADCPRHRARSRGSVTMNIQRNMSTKRKVSSHLSRREMLAGSAGLSFAFALGAPSLFGEGEAVAQAGGRLNAYVSIAKDGTITIMSPALEMGQGVNTSLPLIIAEELDADWAKVKVQQAPINAVYNHPILQQQLVVGSLTTRGYWMPLPHGGGAGAPRAARCGGRALEGAGRGAHHRAEHRGACGVEAPDELRRDRELRQGPGEDAGDQARPAQAGEALPADRQGRAASRRGRQVVRQAALRHATCRCRAWSTARWRARRCAAPARPRSTATSSRSCPASSTRSRSTTASASSATRSRRCLPRAAS